MSGGGPLVGRVLRLANEVHGLARAAGRGDIREPLAEHAARWTEGVATVVVAGAQKRGKSRLLNVLVGRPDLLPVDADVATHTQVALRRGDTLRVTVTRTVTGADGATATVETEIDPAELPAHASVLGDPAVLRTVTGLDVALDEPLLEGLRLVDTPGVDSMTLGHRHATMAALSRADALLFAVSSQDQPILRHELEFLAEAAVRLHTIAFVLTKVEDSTAWRALLAENRERLARFVGTEGPGVDPAVAKRLLDAPWLPVSAKLGEAALALAAAGHAERAEARLERSGLPALRRFLRTCADRRELVRAGNVLAVAVAGLAALTAAEEDRAAGAAGVADDLAARQAAVDTELAALTALRRERRRRGIDHQLLGRGVTNRARARLETYRRTYEREIAELTTPAAISRYAEGLADSVERTMAAAWDEIAVDVERTVSAALPRYLVEMGADPAELDAVAVGAPARLRADLSADAPQARFDVIGEGLPAMMMAGGAGFMAYNALGFAALAIPLIAPLALGGLLAGTLVAHRRRVAAAARNQSALIKALGSAFTVATNEMCLTAEQAVASWRGAAEDAVDVAFVARQKELDARRKELSALAAQDAAQRSRVAAAAAEQLGTLADCTDRARELGRDLAAALRLPPSTDPPP